MTSQRFRKKPIVIEAMQLTENNRHDVGKWCKAVTMYYDGIDIKTLEGVMRANLGDWVVRGVQGEFYPVKPDIFRETYERAEVSFVV